MSLGAQILSCCISVRIKGFSLPAFEQSDTIAGVVVQVGKDGYSWWPSGVLYWSNMAILKAF